jgi:hypothetical protein
MTGVLFMVAVVNFLPLGLLHKLNEARVGGLPARATDWVRTALCVGWATEGGLIAAVPTGLGAQLGVAGRVVATLALLALPWSIGWSLAGRAAGCELAWRMSLRAGLPKLSPAYLVGLAGLSTGVLGVFACLGIPGGDVGVVVAVTSLAIRAHRLGQAGARALRRWRRRAYAVAGHDKVASVALLKARAAQDGGAVITLVDSENAAAVWRHAKSMQRVVGPGWEVTSDPEYRRLTARALPELPDAVSMPTRYNALNKREIPLGVTRSGAQLSWTLDQDAMGLLCGPPGSSKSTTVGVIACGGILRGHRAILASTKWTDFVALSPWLWAFPRTLEELADTVDAVRADIEVVKALLDEHHAVRVSDLPEDLRPSSTLLLVDEFWALLALSGRKTPEARRTNALKEHIRDQLSDLVRLGRFSQTHVLLAMHRSDSTVLDPELKANTTLRILAGGADRVTRSMVLRDGDNVPRVRGRGRALVESELHDAQEVQLYLAALAPSQLSNLPSGTPCIPEVLANAQIPHAKPFTARQIPKSRSAYIPQGGLSVPPLPNRTALSPGDEHTDDERRR